MVTLHYLPKRVEECIREKFGFPLMGQVATVTPEGPTIRTMRMYEFSQKGQLIFLSHCHSNKWKQLKRYPNIAICFLNQDMSIQITVNGSVTLTSGDQEPLQSYWEIVRTDVKKIYDHYDVEGPYMGEQDLTPPEQYPSSFGMILVNPIKWEMLELSPNNYPESKRMLYNLDHGKWIEQRINVG